MGLLRLEHQVGAIRQARIEHFDNFGPHAFGQIIFSLVQIGMSFLLIVAAMSAAKVKCSYLPSFEARFTP
jgi:hypothetical protein